jgi:polysaccharide export outer membrane protein
MKKNPSAAVTVVIILLLSSSCVTRGKITYLQYSDKKEAFQTKAEEARISVTPSAYKVMPYDNLLIRVITPDPQWSQLFNLDVGASGLTQESAALSGYNVDANGNIEIPFVGKVEVSGKTLSQIKSELDSIFKSYVTDGAISVRLVNNYVSILGEVRVPGRYPLTKDRVNVFEALAMAGDINEYGNRRKVQLIRPSQYGPVIKEFALSDRQILSSEYYYIMPNDIIYCMPTKAKTFQINATPLTLALSTISTALVIISFLRTL